MVKQSLFVGLIFICAIMLVAEQKLVVYSDMTDARVFWNWQQVGTITDVEIPLAFDVDSYLGNVVVYSQEDSLLSDINEENTEEVMVHAFFKSDTIRVESKKIRYFVTEDSADVIIDGIRLKPANHHVGLYRGFYPLQVFAKGFKTISKMIEITDETEYQLSMDLNSASVEIVTAPEINAQLYIGDKDYGTTPFRESRFISGDYACTLKKEGWVTEEFILRIGPKYPVKKQITMVRDAGKLVLSTNDAEIWIGETYAGTGKIEKYLEPGVYDIIVKKDNHHTIDKEITIMRGELVKDTISLEPISGTCTIKTVHGFSPKKSFAGVPLFVDGIDTGKLSDTTIDLYAGDHRISSNEEEYSFSPVDVTIHEHENKEITMPVVSLQWLQKNQKASSKRRNYSLIASVLALGGSIVFNSISENYYDDYLGATTVQDHASLEDKFQNYEMYRNVTIGFSMVSVAYAIHQHLFSRKCARELNK